MHTLKNYFLAILLLLCYLTKAQNYHAINGSSYAGSMGTNNNPASIVQVPFNWDVTLFSVQLKQSTNAFKIRNYSLLSAPANANLVADNGTKKRFVFANQDIHLLNARINLSPRSAIAFGANIRSYEYASTSSANYQDSSYSLADFMKINVNHSPLSGESRASAWAEIYASYARTIIDDGDHLLSAGLTIKVNRGLAGGYANARGVNYFPAVISGRDSYVLTAGSLQYGYSSNFDAIDTTKTFAANRKAFLQKTRSGIGADIGVEYILAATGIHENTGDHPYETKIGVSLMDLGNNKYQYSSRSSLAIAGKTGITDTLLENKISGVTTIDDFNDSLATISNSFKSQQGEFYIYQPTRLVINIDQHIASNIFVNADITIPVFALAGKDILFIKDMNMLAVTPRWEKRSLGVYFPFLLNTRQQLWAGAAVRTGPVLLGTHNLANLFAKDRSQNGGLYFAFTIRPGKKRDQQTKSSDVKQSGNAKRSLQCPKF